MKSTGLKGRQDHPDFQCPSANFVQLHMFAREGANSQIWRKVKKIIVNLTLLELK